MIWAMFSALFVHSTGLPGGSFPIERLLHQDSIGRAGAETFL
jgi:hypothetical protein